MFVLTYSLAGCFLYDFFYVVCFDVKHPVVGGLVIQWRKGPLCTPEICANNAPAVFGSGPYGFGFGLGGRR